MTTSTSSCCPTVIIIGAGASGTLTAIQLLREAGRRSTGLDVQLLDPAGRWGEGVAFGTPDPEHLLNVPASGMSAFPEDPAHFVSWRARQFPQGGVNPAAFAPRRQYALYLQDTLRDAAVATADLVTLTHVRARAVGVRRTASGVAIATDDGRELPADAAIVATGLPQVGHGWAPEPLRASAFFVADPWTPGALEVVRRDHTGPADVLMVGTGLTMVDVTLSLSGRGNRTDRRLHSVSRHARLPQVHATEPTLAAIPDISDWGTTLEQLRSDVARHIADVKRAAGDWRPAVDGLRFQISTLWGRLSEDDRLAFLSSDAGTWNVIRHRMAPSSAVMIRELSAAGRLAVDAAEVVDARPLPMGGLAVTLSDDSRRDVGWVVNCTGPQADVRCLGNPLLNDLLRPRPAGSMATVATAGMGFRTVEGRLIDSDGRTETPLWTLGALRRGELFESTAIPEIRSQALAVAGAVLHTVTPLPRRLADGRLVSGGHPVARPRDPLGLPLSTTAEAAAAYNAGLERVMRLQSGGAAL
jgi:uncharacterized NAD(P)/FAD-binding protein YdhS